MVEWRALDASHFSDLGVVEGTQLPRFTKLVEQKAYVLLIDGLAVCAVFFLSLAPGTVNVTFCPGVLFRRNARKTIEAILNEVESYAVVNGIRRMQATCCEETKYISFLERCGFEKEGRMREFNDGRDEIMFVRFFKAVQ